MSRRTRVVVAVALALLVSATVVGSHDAGRRPRLTVGCAGPTSGATSRAVAFSPDGRVLLAGCRDGVRVWDVATGHRLRTLGTGPGLLAVSPVGRLLAVGGPAVTLWNWDDGSLLGTVPVRPNGRTTPLTVTALAVSPAGACSRAAPSGVCSCGT
jgi:WD40 repeat protein